MRPPHLLSKHGFGDFISGLSSANREIVETVIKRAK